MNLYSYIRKVAQEEAAKVYKRVQNTVRHGQATLAPNESGVVQTVQVSLGPYETVDLTSVQLFGVASSMPVNSNVTVVNAEGHSTKGLVIASNHQPTRPKNMAVGEVQLYDASGQQIYLQNGVNIVITSQQTIAITAPSGVTITAPNVAVSGNLVVGTGATGTFSTPTGLVVTVQDGIVTNIF